MKISGYAALVTGGASGIGQAVCEVLLKHGAKVHNANRTNFTVLVKVTKWNQLSPHTP